MSLISKKAAIIKQRVEEKFKPKKERVVQLNSIYNESKNLKKLFNDLNKAPKQKAIILALIDNYKNINSWIKVSTLKEITNINTASIKSLIDKNFPLDILSLTILDMASEPTALIPPKA